jgi:transcription elongation factor Elf1
MQNKLHIGWCPFCDQGWVNAVKDSGNSKIFLLCYECDTIWDTHENFLLGESNNYNLVGEVEIPSPKDIEDYGWDKLIIDNNEC